MLKKIEAFVRSWLVQFAVLLFMLFLLIAQKTSYDLAMTEARRWQAEAERQEAVVQTYEASLDYANLQLAEKNEELYALADKYAQLRDGIMSQAFWTATDINDIVTMVIAEAGNQSLKGQMAVAQCILDRYKAGYGGDSIHEILTARGQFTLPYKGDASQYPKSFEAVVRVFIYGERVFDQDCIYFYNPSIADPRAVAAFENNNAYLGTIGDHVFRSW